MPPHLQLTLLNVPSTAESTTSLPRPQHVILNHIYVQRGQVGFWFRFFFSRGARMWVSLLAQGGIAVARMLLVLAWLGWT